MRGEQMDESSGTRRALVTGAASGIGAATARLLHARGAHVVLGDIDVDGAQRLAGQLAGRVDVRRLDVTDEDDWEVLGDELAAGGPLDVLVHAAGAASRSPIDETTLAEFRRMVDLNLVGTFLALRAVSRLMTRGGAVVTLSSLRGVVATSGLGAYGAAKSGVRVLSRVAALELADRGIRVNAVCPGSIDTPITSGPGFQDDDMAAYVASIPLRRRGTAEEVAHAIGFLVGDDSGYVTGTDLVIDGGTAAGRTTPRKRDEHSSVQSTGPAAR
jgi:NAD(P)-dependent dehydrogenase (short-subunit alcohol dehydrogenase family)